MSYYDVTSTPIDDCVITPAGEFCGETGGPSTQKITVELQEKNTLLYFGEELWLASGTEGDRVVVKEEKTTKECTVSRKRILRFNITTDESNNERFLGTLEESTRVEGPSICGDTPTGTRLLSRLSGTPATSF